jgi:tetratricopeptide (TPR) repeat protein
MMTFPKGRTNYYTKPHFSIKSFAGENINDVLQWYDKMIEVYPDNQDLYFGKADLLSQKSQNREAIAVLDRLLALDSEDAMAWYKKGEMLYELKEDRKALECFKRAVSITSVFEDAWLRMGEILMNLDDYEQARKVFQHVIDLNPKNNIAVSILVMLDEYYERSSHPEQYLSIPGRGKPNKVNEVDTELAELFGEESSMPSKPVNYEEQNVDPADILAASKDLVIRGKGLQSQGEFIQALRLFNEALELNRLCWDAWKAKGDLFLQMGKTEEATFCYYKAMYLALSPVTGDQDNDIAINESKYNEWRNKFFSSGKDVDSGADDT